MNSCDHTVSPALCVCVCVCVCPVQLDAPVVVRALLHKDLESLSLHMGSEMMERLGGIFKHEAARVRDSFVTHTHTHTQAGADTVTHAQMCLLQAPVVSHVLALPMAHVFPHVCVWMSMYVGVGVWVCVPVCVPVCVRYRVYSRTPLSYSLVT